MNILAVDDKQLALNAVLRAVHEVDPEGTCHGVTSGEEALDWAREHHPQVVFTDIEMPGLGGLEHAKMLREIDTKINVVFATAHGEYALEAHGLYPSGFLMKPVTVAGVREALENLRHPAVEPPAHALSVRCFGNFEVFADGRPLKFKRTKTKELFAYLIDRNGSRVTIGEVMAILWEDGQDSVSRRAQVRNLISDLRSTLASVDHADVLERGRDSIAIVPSLIDCDYFKFLACDNAAVNSYNGEYMSQYSWSEMTLSRLGY